MHPKRTSGKLCARSYGQITVLDIVNSAIVEVTTFGADSAEAWYRSRSRRWLRRIVESVATDYTAMARLLRWQP